MGTYILWLLRARPLLVWGQANVSRNVLKLQDGPLEIFVQKFFLQNLGRKAAHNVEFVLSAKPGSVSVFEPRESELKELPDGEYAIKLPYVAAKELVIIDCAYLNQRASLVSSVKCEEGRARQVLFWTVRKFARRVEWAIVALLVFGIAFVIQFGLAFLGSR
jgi:hypothetical protein